MMKQEYVKIEELPVRAKSRYAQEKFKKVRIHTNYFPAKIKNVQTIYVCKIKIDPSIMHDDRLSRNRILCAIQPQLRSQIANPVFCGMSIYSAEPPNQTEGQYSTETHKVSIKQVKVINTKGSFKFLSQFLNNGLNNMMEKLNYSQIASSGKYFKINNPIQSQELAIYPGYRANFVQINSKNYLRVDSAFKIRQKNTVLQAINDLYNANRDKDRDQKRAIVREYMVNRIAMTNYGKARYIKIIDIQFSKPQETFVSEVNMTVAKYFEQKYNFTIKNKNQPLIVSQQKKGKRKIYLLPEYCLMTGLPEDIDEGKRKSISNVTSKSVHEKKKTIQGMLEEISGTPQYQAFKQLGVELSKKPLQLEVKCIPSPSIRLGDGNQIEHGKQTNFGILKPIYCSKNNLNLGIICFDRYELQSFSQEIKNTSERLNAKLKIKKYKMGTYKPDTAMGHIERAIRNARAECNLCLIVLPANMKSKYAQVKKFAIEEQKMNSQVMLQTSLKHRNFRSVITKVLLQMLAKIGNTLWRTMIPKEMENSLMIGFDTHKSGGKNVMCGIATVNKRFTTFTNECLPFQGNNDKFQVKSKIALRLLQNYLKYNNKLPKDIIILYNSCSNDEIKLHQELFINDILQKMKKEFELKAPKLTVLLVNKKTSQRFFIQFGGIDTARNPYIGTLVADQNICQNNDFYLVSQNSHKGSILPNHYKTIFTNSDMDLSILHELIFAQCFNYANWSGSIKIPGVLQCSKKCAKFNCQVLQGRNIQDFNYLPYYL